MKKFRLARFRKTFVVTVITAAASGGFLFLSSAHAAPTFVQAAGATANGGSSSIAKAFASANTAGNLIVASVSWAGATTAGSLTCSDSKANTYAVATTQWDSTNSRWLGVCYASGIKSGTNTVTATFGASRTTRRLIVHEYSGVAAVSPLDVVAKNAAAGTTAANTITSTAATTGVSGDLLFGAVIDTTSTTSITAGTGFTQRSSLNNKDMATQDMLQATAGSVASTQTFGAAHRYIAIMAAFKPQIADTQAPTVPTGLSGTGVSPTQINLSWTAATDNVGVAGYKIFRGGTQVGTSASTSFQDTGLAISTSYSYTVAAYDAAGNTSAQSAAANVSTTADTTAPSVPTNLTLQVMSSTQITLNWTAATDNVGVTGYRIYRCTGAGCTNWALVNTTAVTPVQDPGLTPSTTYTYAVTAIDAAGNESAKTPPAQATTAAPDNTPPAVSMTAPASGSTVSGAVTVSANATDTGTGVHDVQFFLEGNPLGADDTTAPYSVTWDTTTTQNGLYHLTAVAKDNAGNISNTSGAFTVTVNNQPSQLPVDLVGGWNFNESTGATSADVTAYGNTATFGALGSPAWAPGKYGSGVKFNGGTLDYLTINDSPTMNITGTTLTLSMWINPGGGTTNDQVAFGKFWNGTSSDPHYQYGLELDRGLTPHFYIGTGTSTTAGAGMGSALPVGQWSHLAVVYDGARVSFYLNGNLMSTPSMAGAITSRLGSTIRIGADIDSTQKFVGSMDDVRLYKRALTQAEVQADKNMPLVSSGNGIGPAVAIAAPTAGQQVSNIFTLTATASDETVGVQFFVDGTAVGPEDTAAPFAANWDTRTAANGAHTITARARDGGGNTTVSNPVTANVSNSDTFTNEILATGFNLPTAMKFLPDGRMLVAELGGRIKVVPTPYTTPDTKLFLDISGSVAVAGVQEGIFDFALDPNFTNNHYFYVFYTANDGKDRLSRFTANAAFDGTLAGTELVLYTDPVNIPSDEHHGGAIAFANDGKIFFTTGEHFQGTPAQDLTSPWGKVHRINPDGSVPTDNPFYDGAGPNYDSIWALGLRNPYRAYYDAPTGRLLIGDVGGNNNPTAYEEVNLGARGANYGWPNCEFGTCGNSAYTPALYAYPHINRDASITGGFVYHANGGSTPFPSGMEGSYFFADYAQNWIKRLTFDASGNVSGVSNFEPMDGILDGPYGDIVYLTEGPDGSLYYVDLGYSDVSGTFGTSKVRRIRYQQSNQSPTAVAASDTTAGPAPLAVNFNSTGSADPEGQPLTYSWDFGDGTPLSTAANPAHTYTTAGVYTVRLTVSDGVTSTFAPPLTLSAGSAPVATINAPTDGATFRAGDAITFGGDGTDPDDGSLPASAYTWTIDFLHDGHVHPGQVITGVKSGSFTVPTSGHDFSGNTRYRVMLTVTDSNGLTNTKTAIVWPQKVNLTFNSAPSGATLYLDGVALTTPFVHDDIIGFNHTIEARNQTVGTSNYTFASWSDGGAQQHTLIVPATDQSYTATYTVTTVSNGPAAAWGFNEGTGVTGADASGHGNTATLVNGPAWVTGKHGAGVSFDGANDYLSLANSATLDIAGSNLTMSMWVNPASVSGDSVMLGKFWNAAMTSPYYQYGLELQSGKPVFQIGTASGVVGAAMSSTLPLNQWSYLSIVFNGTQVQFYLNGTLVNTATLNATITARGQALRLAADISNQQFYKGLLDDVRIYNRTQTTAEIQADMNTGL